MDRRRFLLTPLAGAFAVPFAARAQPARKVGRIGILSLSVPSDMIGPEPRSPSVNALLRGLRELGYVYARDFVTEPRRAADRQERVPSLAAELVVKQATSTIPVELLKELVPAATLVAILWDQASLPVWQATEAIARGRGWKLLSLEIRDARGIEEAFRVATKARASAIVVAAIRSTAGQAPRVAELAAKSRLPAMYEFRLYSEAGGLISYGVDTIDLWQRAATFVDKILKGANPGDLPIEQPAKALGLTIPPSLLARADQVIE